MSIELTLTGVNTPGTGSAFVPYLRHYLGLWAMDDASFDQELSQIEQINLWLHVQARQRDPEAEQRDAQSGTVKPRYGFELSSDGIATVEIVGTMMKHEASLMESTSTLMMRRTLRTLAADSSVKGVMLAIDSPGGTAAGTDELAADIVALAQAKPVSAYVSGIGASAAYFVAAQAGDIVASPMSNIGSIGTMAVIYDTSKRQEASGVKIHVIKAGEFKGLGVPGTPVDPKTLDELQRRIDSTQRVFSQAVADGRGVSLEQVAKWADGRVHVSADALSLGLIDHVGTMDAAMERLRKQMSSTRPTGRKGFNMSATGATTATSAAATEPTTLQTATSPATPPPIPQTFAGTLLKSPSMADRIAEIEAACPGASSDFVLAQVKADASNETAQRNFIKQQGEMIAQMKTLATDKDGQITTLKAENDQLKAKVNTAAANSVNQPVQQTPTGQTAVASGGDVVAEAKAEWAANKNHCQADYMSEEVYVNTRKYDARKKR